MVNQPRRSFPEVDAETAVLVSAAKVRLSALDTKTCMFIGLPDILSVTQLSHAFFVWRINFVQQRVMLRTHAR